MKIAFANSGLPDTGIVCVGVLKGNKLTESAKTLDTKLKGSIKRAISVGRFEGNLGQSVSIPAPAGTKLDTVLIVGLGDPKKLDDLAMQSMGGRIYSAVAKSGSTAVSICVDTIKGCCSDADLAHKIAREIDQKEKALVANLSSMR